ncbi:disease resistance protein RPS5-like [Macadamia integrifolia]|uniref:disease resistance protein RPS5-like n=1 Tax=Macadamia integrifolia TaxID=60698 RepID=UPI001C52AFA1|nr:disease resistance protein RPS5-like [Macadamia integrifolia]
MAAASSSSSSTFQWNVFLSFRGKDTRNNFTSHLYAALDKEGIKTFKDDEKLKKGELISDALKKAIKKSRFSIIIFSRNYANSRWCLEELAWIMERWEKHGQKVFPVFLSGVNPLDVENQKGGFGEPFDEHEKHFSREMVERWRSALRVAAQLSGWSFKDFGNEDKLIKMIVKDISGALSGAPSPKPVIEIPTEPIIENQPSTQRKLQQMLDCIHDPDPRFGIIGVYGMGGVGKTTLAREVNNHFEKDMARGLKIPFEIVIMVTVSATPNVQSIQNEIGDRHGLNDNRVNALLKELKKKKFLLIFDDVWCKLKLEDIGIPHPRTHKGSKILVTSWSKDTCTDMGARKTIKMHPLSEAESWNLFFDVAGEHVAADGIKCFAEKIVGRCKGLSLAIVTVARAMANQVGVGEWANAVREIEQSATEIRGMKEEVFVPLKFSFDRLENDMLRSLFLYFASFPEDYDIGEDEMLNFLVEEGLVDKLGSLTAARNKGEALIRGLKIACMLERGRHENCVKMHDVIRELALWITSANSQFDSSPPKFLTRSGESVKEAPRALEWLNTRRISFMYTQIEKFPELGERCPNLINLLLRQTEICIVIPPTNFLQNMDRLTILDLSHSILESLPNSLSCLVNLRVLRLQDCHSLTSLPALGMLRQLQVLDLNWCIGLDQQILGSSDQCMGGLSNLRYLDVVHSTVSIPVGLISRLHRLEELKMLGARKIKWRMNSDDDDQDGKRDGYTIIFLDVEELSYITNLTSLSIGFEDIIISDWFKPLAKKIKELELKRCIFVKQAALKALNHESQNLRDLRIKDCQGMTCMRIGDVITVLENCKDLEEVVFDNGSNRSKDLEVDFNGYESYHRIRSLKLRRLPRLKRICFSQLTHILIDRCNSLKIVFTKGMLRLLNNLDRLAVSNCERIEEIIEEAGEEEEYLEGRNSSPSNSNRVITISPFPRLLTLYLGDLPALHHVCNNHILNCPLIGSVTVLNCPRLNKDLINIRNLNGLLVLDEENSIGERWWIKGDKVVTGEEIQA